MDSYKISAFKRHGRPACDAKRIWVSSKADAFLDGVGSLLDLFPDPREKTIRAFHCYHHTVRAHSVSEAIGGDWAAIGLDMWSAIEAHAPEESTEEAAARLKTVPTR